jgi:hypothetical protein
MNAAHGLIEKPLARPLCCEILPPKAGSDPCL